jgi:prepilin-type N-terminal cleavage/methylation domain-containing protein
MPIFPPPTDPLSRQSGFTLMEMLVVLSIVGLLLAVAVPMIGGRLPLGQSRLEAKVATLLATEAQRSIGSGQVIAVDLANAGAGTELRFVPQIGTDRQPIFFPDGSSNGGLVFAGQAPLVSIRWIDSEVAYGQR